MKNCRNRYQMFYLILIIQNYQQNSTNTRDLKIPFLVKKQENITLEKNTETNKNSPRFCYNSTNEKYRHTEQNSENERLIYKIKEIIVKLLNKFQKAENNNEILPLLIDITKNKKQDKLKENVKNISKKTANRQTQRHIR